MIRAISITPDHELLAGRRRLAAPEHLGRTEIPARVVADETDYEARHSKTRPVEIDLAKLDHLPFDLRVRLDENFQREDYTQTELAEIHRSLIALKAKQTDQGTRTDLLDDDEPAEPDEPEPAPETEPDATCAPLGRTSSAAKKTKRTRRAKRAGKRKFPRNTTAKVATAFGETERTVRRRLAVVKAAEKDPGQHGHLLDKLDRTGNVSGVHRLLMKAQAAAAIEIEPPPLPTAPFRVILIDPPWQHGMGA